MAETLLVVDVQRGFVNSYTRHVPDRVRRLALERRYRRLFFTRFVNVPDSYYHQLLD